MFLKFYKVFLVRYITSISIQIEEDLTSVHIKFIETYTNNFHLIFEYCSN